MVVILSLVVALAALIIWGAVTYHEGWAGVGAFGLLIVLIVWGVLTLMNLECRSLGESYQEDTRYDWLTGCMLPLDDGREIQIDEESIALVVRNLIEDR